MSLMEKEHAESALSYTTTYTIREVSVEQHGVEREIGFLGTSAQLELTRERLGTDTDSHRG